MIKRILILTVVIGAIFACSSSDEGSGTQTDNYNRVGLLENIADNIIIPAYQDLNTDLSNLVTAKDNFITNSNQANLEALRTNWLEAYKTWQYIEMFNIGKAEELFYSDQMNIYPTNTSEIESNIVAGNYDLTHVNNNDAVGFPAVDYMLYGVASSDAAILTVYSNANYSNYLSDLIDQMQTLTNTVYADWTSSYINVFVASTDNTASSAVNKFINDYIYYYEKGLRANKIGVPAGVFSSGPLPSKLEGVYSADVSKVLVLDALQGVQDMFNGKAYGNASNGDSFYAYLVALDRTELATLINTRFNNARQKIEALESDFNSQITTDNSKMTEAYDALQLVVISLKVDMLQAFNVSVDYVDADGD